MIHIFQFAVSIGLTQNYNFRRLHIIKIKEIKYQNDDKEHGQSRIVKYDCWEKYVDDLVYEYNGITLYNPLIGKDMVVFDIKDGDDWFTIEGKII